MQSPNWKVGDMAWCDDDDGRDEVVIEGETPGGFESNKDGWGSNPSPCTYLVRVVYGPRKNEIKTVQKTQLSPII